ncbi:MAG: hypothetical protein J6A08_02605 [Lachnospiraceae bacterium]|nr:hypothetical protein [Lachnospiraceae bacterium]
MAIVISKSSGLNDDLWKPVGQVINGVMQDADNEKTQHDQLVKDIAVEKKSKKYAEKQTGLTSLSSFDVVSEGDNAPADDMQETFPKLIVHSQFMKDVAMTKQMLDDGDLDGMKTIARNLVLGYKRTRAELATNALVTEGSEFVIGPKKKKLDKTTGDGLGLFATDHKSVKATVKTQSNVFTNGFGTDATMLIRLSNIGRNFLNDSGQVTGYTFNKIIIPGNCYALEETIQRIMKSSLLVGSDYNDVNTQKGKWTLVVDPLWQAAEGTAPYIIMSDEANKAYNGTVFYDRTPLDVKSEVNIHNRNLEYNGYGRMSCGFNNWRHVILGGATQGTTLT